MSAYKKLSVDREKDGNSEYYYDDKKSRDFNYNLVDHSSVKGNKFCPKTTK